MVPHGLPCLLIEGLGETESRFGTEGSEASVGVMGWRLGSVASDGVSPWAMVWRGQCLDDYKHVTIFQISAPSQPKLQKPAPGQG